MSDRDDETAVAELDLAVARAAREMRASADALRHEVEQAATISGLEPIEHLDRIVRTHRRKNREMLTRALALAGDR